MDLAGASSGGVTDSLLEPFNKDALDPDTEDLLCRLDVEEELGILLPPSNPRVVEARGTFEFKVKPRSVGTPSKQAVQPQKIHDTDLRAVA